jgi:nucleoside-diphosphate-sugar epimerase
MKNPRILLVGANGQIGTELAAALALRYGPECVVTSDIVARGPVHGLPHEQLDVTDAHALASVIHRHQIQHVYQLAATLSATGEKHPQRAWDLNMRGLLNVLELARQKHVERVFWPSSIAVFGSTTPADQTPQTTVTEPLTVYGISKLAGEGWCRWYHRNHGVDVRSLRFPGLISWRAPGGGGTTDYALDIFRAALREGRYTCFLEAHQALPMMYMDDAIRATLELMAAPDSRITERGSYNVGAMSFTPAQIAREITRHLPTFTIDYAPDHRQRIASNWPRSVDDRCARRDWGWAPQFDLKRTVRVMLENLQGSTALPAASTR